MQNEIRDKTVVEWEKEKWNVDKFFSCVCLFLPLAQYTLRELIDYVCGRIFLKGLSIFSWSLTTGHKFSNRHENAPQLTLEINQS